MMHLFESFACGLCFTLGAVFGLVLYGFWGKKDREKIMIELRESNKRVEERVGVYVGAMAHILEHVEKDKPKKSPSGDDPEF